MTLNIVVLVLSSIIFQLTWGAVEDSAKYGCPLLPPSIDRAHLREEKLFPANSLHEAWFRMKMALFPDSHYMWLYVYAEAHKVKVSKTGNAITVKTMPKNVVVKNFAAIDVQKCYTYEIQDKNDNTKKGKYMIKLEEDSNNQIVLKELVFDCSDPTEEDTCSLNHVVTKEYLKCLIRFKDIDPCIDYAKDQLTAVKPSVTPNCPLLPSSYKQLLPTFSLELNTSDTINVAWQKFRKTFTSIYNYNYDNVLPPGVEKLNMAGEDRITLGIVNPDGYGKEYMSCTSFQIDDANHCHSVVVSARLPEVRVNSKYRIVLDIVESDGKMYLQGINYECLVSNYDYINDACYIIIYHHLKLQVTYGKCMIELEDRVECGKKSKKAWELHNHV